MGEESSTQWLKYTALRDGEEENRKTSTESLSSGAEWGSILSDKDYRMAERVAECGLLPAVSVVGIPANILNMLVFHRQGLRDKMNLCLFSLAVVDLLYWFCMLLSTLYCLAAFLPSLPTQPSYPAFLPSLPTQPSYPAFLPSVFWEQVLKWNIRKHVINFVYAFWYTSGTLTAIIATERCICVALPMKSSTIVKTKTMICMILGAVTVINLLCMTYALKHYVGVEHDGFGNTTVVLKDTALFLTHEEAFQIISDSILPSLSFTTFFVVLAVTAVTVRKLKTAMNWRQTVGSSFRDRRQITLVKMLLTVSCVYIVCNIPKVSLGIVRFLVSEFSTSGKYRNLFFVAHRAGHVLLMVNSSVNVFIYYKQSSRFRKELRGMCFSCFQSERDKNLATNSQCKLTLSAGSPSENSCTNGKLSTTPL